MNKIKKLEVIFNEKKIGTLALLNKSKIDLLAFQYDDEWIKNGFSISPFSLPLENKVFIPKIDPFNGMFGVFSDSLPDGWGKLLVDRTLKKNNIDPFEITSLDRLAIVGNSGMGGLEYIPQYDFEIKSEIKDLDELALSCKKILNTEYSENLDELFLLGGSSGGARPKILTNINGEDWIIKFPSKFDNDNIGKQEYDYSLCAKKCGIFMPETKLFPSKNCSGFFGVKRFDREKNSENKIKKIHMVSVSGLLETSHRIPNLDYDILMKLTLKLTNDFEEVKKMYRLMCFNIFAHNRDDHSKNFSFLYNEVKRKWELSPAYDLTYSNSIGGEHATTIAGNGKNPTIKDILKVAENIGLKKDESEKIALEIKKIVENDLKEYL
ncbi:type II toxin-antitoxin system HipA family toxin [Fusobacterium perfoetens]|uniref:type II toxin-antitoxin system HipA family toxin n=1 Tax=Fusobacterium perfoetens TaxID=852 RepID=UPI001F316E69|nr:type II toxin-antitoxin system HipA family toxin [Fusobacterium perfoetens]MCF2611438.1 type II toxin-antitoxin system HipA family toxin [Fusobacterium perfoetens]